MSISEVPIFARGKRWVPVSRPPSLLEVGGLPVLMSTEEQGVAVLKSLYAVGGIHDPLSIPIKCSRCPCPHPHFE